MYGFDEYGSCKKAVAYISGGPLCPGITGVVYFHDTIGGTIVTAQISGLPEYKPGTASESPIGPHGFHIHENGSCQVGDPNNPFQAAGGTGISIISPMEIIREIFLCCFPIAAGHI